VESDQPSKNEVEYRIAGAGRDTFTKTQLRDHIRSGQITPETELAVEGSEEYRPASAFPELARYFALAAPKPAALKTSAPATPVATRLIPGLLYPFTGIGWIIIAVVALLGTLPFGSLIASLFTSVYVLAVIRRSSEGSKVMPPPSDVGDPGTFVMSWLKVIVVTLVSAWPILAAIPLMFMLRSSAVLFIAVFVMVLYYPAALASLAKWNTISLAVSPSSIFRFIGVLGMDYAVAMIAPVFGLAVSLGATYLASRGMGPAGRGVVSSFFATWLSFYWMHLLGWAMQRHSDEF
jgi:hypothetical protein